MSRVSRLTSRSWVGTLNNYTDAELELLKAHECRYMALGFHVGLKSHLPHVHIVVEYKSARARPKFIKRIHWEVRRGNLKQALDYLNKEDKLEERGDRPRLDQKISTSFEDMYEDAKKGVIHPEWVLTWRSIDTGNAVSGATYHQNITMSSSLSRNLNSGDAIKFVLVANNVNSSNTFQMNAVAHFSCVLRNN